MRRNWNRTTKPFEIGTVRVSRAEHEQWLAMTKNQRRSVVHRTRLFSPTATREEVAEALAETLGPLLEITERLMVEVQKMAKE